MSQYLLTWNPRKAAQGGDSSTDGLLDYQHGDEVWWPCHSQQPKLGDTVYLIRLGVEPRGVIAKGIITQESFQDTDWADDSKPRSFVRFQLQALRNTCEQGLLPIMLLQSAMSEQKWISQTSGIQIKPEYTAQLEQLWQQGEGTHSLQQYFAWYSEQKFNYEGWYKRYCETCDYVQHIKNNRTFSNEDIQILWADKGNGIASVGQGFMYKKELQANVDFLKLLTREIFQSPTEETYQNILKRWKTEGAFDRHLWIVIHRVFAAVAPEQFTSIVDENYLASIFHCLREQYQIDISNEGSWLSKNRRLLTKVEPYFIDDWDAPQRNIMLWSLSDWDDEDLLENVLDTPSEVNDNKAVYRPEQQVQQKMNPAQNLILFGPPGTGKTYELQQRFAKYISEVEEQYAGGTELNHAIKRFSCVTFHQSYGYEEFIEGLKAKTSDTGEISYVVEPGAFVKLCRLAEQDPNHRYAMFIDEINRGNVSKIFGELITLIELDKRETLSINLAYSGTSFSVPSNVDIIGTMNTADRSLTMLDTALRRRFDFEEMMPNPSLLAGVCVKGVNLAELLTTMNQRIEILYDREHMLGHAFFIPVKKVLAEQGEDKAFEQLIGVFKNKIIPLLQEYFFDDWHKIRLVLGDNQKSDDKLQFVLEDNLSSGKLNDLFGHDHNLNQFGDVAKQYTLKRPSDGVWKNAAAFLGIYAKSENFEAAQDGNTLENQ
ncbi:McrB family protein [Shewanella mangrovisoli]|uniref:McrB family protein n=1 Tax=Shewanella mangrovisoli TaxID=2864211 RepID=A0ABV4VN42_9GAMM